MDTEIIPRNPIDITNKIMAVVPDEHKKIFMVLAEQFKYKAPEQARECFIILFNEFGSLLMDINKNQGEPVNEWQFKGASIISTKSVEQLKKEYLEFEDKN